MCYFFEKYLVKKMKKVNGNLNSTKKLLLSCTLL
jgi:hypothetical protein